MEAKLSVPKVAVSVCLLTLLANGPRSKGSNLDMLEREEEVGKEGGEKKLFGTAFSI